VQRAATHSARAPVSSTFAAKATMAWRAASPLRGTSSQDMKEMGPRPASRRLAATQTARPTADRGTARPADPSAPRASQLRKSAATVSDARS
jgi:hypothetical protein